jgi:hypothetical protein
MTRRGIVFGGMGFIAGAFAVGVGVNALLDYLSAPRRAVIESSVTQALQVSQANAAAEPGPAADPAKPTDIKTIIVRTVPIPAERAQPALPYAGEIARTAQPLAAITYSGAKANDVTASIAPRAAKPAATPAGRIAASEDANDPFSPAQIERVKTALRLTPAQEAHWPAVEAELRAIAKQQPKKGAKTAKIKVAPESADRLRWAATPLILSLREDQKQTARFIARSMGLEEVAAAL